MADDLAQDAFIKAHKNLADLKDKDASRAWLFQIAYRSYVDHVRKDVRRREFGERQVPPADDLIQAPTGMHLDIERAMNNLGEDCRAVVILCLAYGFSHNEAAQATNMALGTVKSHVTRGKSKLRAFLSAYEKANS